jgi:hypothetical protein
MVPLFFPVHTLNALHIGFAGPELAKQKNTQPERGKIHLESLVRRFHPLLHGIYACKRCH